MPKKPPKHTPVGALNSVQIWSLIDESDDRTTAVLLGAFVENGLALAISSRLIQLGDDDQKRLFE